MQSPRTVKIKIPHPQVAAERQRLEDERAYMASAAAVGYRPADQAILLKMRSGVTLTIPVRFVDELAGASEETLTNDLTLAPGGDAISVRSLDVDIAISGLVRDVLGLNFQSLGGRAKTEAKAEAARANGVKGGRPRSEAVSAGIGAEFAQKV